MSRQESGGARASGSRLHRIVRHPALLALASGTLFLTSLHEVLSSAEAFQLGAHHGLLVYSLLQAARVLPDLLDSATRADEVVEELAEGAAEAKAPARAEL